MKKSTTIDLYEMSWEFRTRCKSLETLLERTNRKEIHTYDRYYKLYDSLYDNLVKKTVYFEYKVLMAPIKKLGLSSNYTVSVKSEIFGRVLDGRSYSVWSSDLAYFNHERDISALDRKLDKSLALTTEEVEGLVWYWGPNTSFEELSGIVSEKVKLFLEKNEKEILEQLNEPLDDV